VDVTIAVIAIVQSGEQEDELGQSLNVISYAVVGWLALEIAVRIVGKGAKYFSEPLCVLELVVVITALFVDGIAILRATRPVLRALRVLRVLLSIYNKRSNAANSLRHAVRMNKRGFVDGQYDLDLCYLNQQVVAMSVPAVGQESMYRNPLERVAQFFNERHPNLYLILNLCSEKDYPVQPFFGRCLRFAFDDHSVPTLAMMLEFGAVVQAFLHQSSKHVAAIHCKGGKGRTGTMCCAFLLSSGICTTASEALGHFECRRTDEHLSDDPKQGVETASQVRFVKYFEQCVRWGGIPMPPRAVRLHAVRLTGFRWKRDRQSFLKVFPWRLERVKREFQKGGMGMPHLDFASGKAVKRGGSTVEALAEGNAPPAQAPGDVTPERAASLQDFLFDRNPNRSASRTKKLVAHALQEEQEAGAMGSVGHCLFNSRMDPCSSGDPTGRTAGSLATTRYEWTGMELELRGEVKFEFHLRDRKRRKKKGRQQESLVHKGSSELEKTNSQDHDVHVEIMLFSCWLHTSFLEHSGTVTSLGRHQSGYSRIALSLGRYDMDRGSHAPRLKSYGPATEVVLEFLIPLELGDISVAGSLGSEDVLGDVMSSADFCV